MQALSRAEPDPNVIYRKSQRSQAAADELAHRRAAAPAPATAAAPATEAPAPKRQRNASPSATHAVPSSPRVVTVEASTSLTAPTGTQLEMEAEIQAAKQLVLDLKRELEVRVANGEQITDAASSSTAVGTVDGRGRKRGVAETEESDDLSNPLKIAGADRAIVRNRRVEAEGFGTKIKRAALGAAIFGLGVGAT